MKVGKERLKTTRPADNLRKYKKKQIPNNNSILKFTI
jgi:hypothetical protein